MSGLRVPVLHGATAGRPDEEDTLRTAEVVRDTLRRLGHAADLVHVGAGPGTPATLERRRPDLVFNLVDAIEGSDARAAEVPAALERLGIPFTGCGARAIERCLSKLDMKREMAHAGLPTPAWSADGAGLDGAGPVIVKAVSEHASVGLDARSVVAGARAAAEIAARAQRFGTPFFAEAYVDGREFNLSVLDGPLGPEVLPPAEIVFLEFPPDRPRIVDYEAKWIEDGFAFDHTPRRFDFAPADRRLLYRLSALALRTWRLFGLSGYARVDFRVDADGRPWILEVNANPCLAPDAGLAAAAARSGMDHDALVARIVATAQERRMAA